MTENTVNVENVVENKAVEKVDEPKTYSQEEVDNIVKGRLAREKEKSKAKYNELEADYKSAQKELADARLLSGVFAEGGGIKGNFAEQAKRLSATYELDTEKFNSIKSEASIDRNADRKTMAFLNAQRFVSESEDDEIAEEYQRINAIPANERTLEEKALFKQIKPKMTETVNNRISEDRKWLNNEVEGADFDKLIRSEEFSQFIEDTGLDIRTGLKAYVKANKQNVIDNFTAKEGKAGIPSTGSAKDSGASKLKEYYSPEDVDNLSAKDYDDPEIMKRVRQSMMKWK